MKLTRTTLPFYAAAVAALLSQYPDLTPEKLAAALAAHSAPPAPPTAPPVDLGEVLTVPEVAKRLHTSEQTVWRMLASCQLPRLKLGARTTRISAAALARFAEGGAK